MRADDASGFGEPPVRPAEARRIERDLPLLQEAANAQRKTNDRQAVNEAREDPSRPRGVHLPVMSIERRRIEKLDRAGPEVGSVGGRHV
jgi:hypothetical protein